jgi:hypothetical protein
MPGLVPGIEAETPNKGLVVAAASE